MPLPRPADASSFLGEKSFSLPPPEGNIKTQEGWPAAGGGLGSRNQPGILPPDHGPQAGMRKDLLTAVKGIDGKCQGPIPVPPASILTFQVCPTEDPVTETRAVRRHLRFPSLFRQKE